MKGMLRPTWRNSHRVSVPSRGPGIHFAIVNGRHFRGSTGIHVRAFFGPCEPWHRFDSAAGSARTNRRFPTKVAIFAIQRPFVQFMLAAQTVTEGRVVRLGQLGRWVQLWGLTWHLSKKKKVGLMEQFPQDSRFWLDSC